MNNTNYIKFSLFTKEKRKESYAHWNALVWGYVAYQMKHLIETKRNNESFALTGMNLAELSC